MTPRVAAINCASCGAVLDLRGGRNVRSVVCGYCGSVMDSHADYRLVARFQGLERPASPLVLGMQGRIKGIEFTVIGTVEYRVESEGEESRWVSHQLFSPTHGYSWLTHDNGHVVFGRRTRDVPEPPSPIPFAVKSRVELNGRTYRMFERYTASIAFVEGELTWVARIGDRVDVVEAIAPPFGLEYEAVEGELAYTLSEYLDAAELHRSFGLEAPPRPVGIHPL